MQDGNIVSVGEMEDMLKNYRRIKFRIAELDARAETPTKPMYDGESPTETAIACSLRLMRFSQSHAVVYRREATALRFILTKIDRVISYLPEPKQAVIRELYINGRTYDEACDVLYVARSTLNKRRREAVTEMCEWMA